MVGWYHRLDGHEFEQAPGVGDGQGRLACCSPWSCKELDMTEQLNNNIQLLYFPVTFIFCAFHLNLWIKSLGTYEKVLTTFR